MTRWPGRRDAEGRLDAEVQFHLDARVADLVAVGMSLEAARSQARREFGGLEQVKEACRDQRATRWLGDAWRDVRAPSARSAWARRSPTPAPAGGWPP